VQVEARLGLSQGFQHGAQEGPVSCARLRSSCNAFRLQLIQPCFTFKERQNVVIEIFIVISIQII
jgi:hypothetical protein